MSIRSECIDALYEQVKSIIPISREAYSKSLDEWLIEPVVIDGERIGVLLTCGNEIHIQLTKQKALCHARRIIKHYIIKKLHELEFLVTRSMNSESDEKFLKRLGFYETSQIGLTKFYRLDQLAIK